MHLSSALPRRSEVTSTAALPSGSSARALPPSRAQSLSNGFREKLIGIGAKSWVCISAHSGVFCEWYDG